MTAIDRTNGERKTFLYAAESEQELQGILAKRYNVEQMNPERIDFLHGRTAAQVIPVALLFVATLVIVAFALAIMFNV